jgi:ABC-2 type transport system ATP-binding protein
MGETRGLTGEQLKQRIEAVIEQCELQKVVEKPIYKLSRGYRQRVGMAQVLLHEPEILIMDEPTAGLDPNQIRQVRELLKELGKTKTIMVSTHIMQEVQAIADRILFIHNGRIVFDGKLKDMIKDYPSLDEAFYGMSSGNGGKQK